MDSMQLNAIPSAQEQIVERRGKLEAAIGALGPRPELIALMAEVDAALERIARGTYGLCETCHEAIEADRLLADPIARFCLDHLTPSEQRALEQDLQLAARVQHGLLPDAARVAPPWSVAYAYRPARLVSGDYCDLIEVDGTLHLLMGDVSGKGVAASTVMAQLHSMFRALLPAGLPLGDLLVRASRLLCESTLPAHYATLVCGRASPDGAVEICNAGHVPPLVIGEAGVRQLSPGGMPIGLFCSQRFEADRVHLAPGELLVLATDGVTEAENGDGEQFGLERLASCVQRHAAAPPAAIVNACLQSVETWRGLRRPDDDMTLMVVSRS
jgi:sigma-B regulation protein RsbU (phosphoserine phosphatase)